MNRLIGFYGDDFTGTSASAEVLAFAGIPTVMFLRNPTAQQLDRFSDRKAIGIAGLARAKSPEWMDANLPAFFETLAGLNTPITHYKVCSTFDSSPSVGSIGRAIDIAAPILGGDWHPLLVAAPAIGRYQLFGNLFALADGEGHRLDRHPTMSRHPVTPMDEADVRLHLGRQTEKSIGLVDYLHLPNQPFIPRTDIVAIDCMDDAGLEAAGRLIWENRGDRLFAIGSQGIEYALVAHWRKIGLIDAEPPKRIAEPKPIVAVSGSCSPATAMQIERAEDNGFKVVPLDAATVIGDWQGELERARDLAAHNFKRGESTIICTARGPEDPAIERFLDKVITSGMPIGEANERIGQGLGQILASLIADTDLSRIAVAGGDTSGVVLSHLGILALEAQVELSHACSINRACSDDARFDGIEIALKGGQMGEFSYFRTVAAGRPIYRGRE